MVSSTEVAQINEIGNASFERKTYVSSKNKHSDHLCGASFIFARTASQEISQVGKLSHQHVQKKFTVTDFREKRFPEENQETVLAGKNGQTEKWAELAQKWMESVEKLFAEKTKTLQRTDKNYTRQLTLSHRFSLIIVLLTQLAVHWQQIYKIRELPLGITGGSGKWTCGSVILSHPCHYM